MAPLPEWTTPRYYLDYTSAGQKHTLIGRASAIVTASEASAAFSSLFTAVSPLLCATTILGMRRSATGTNVSNPVPYTGTSSFGSGSGGPGNAAAYISFIGRTEGGRRVRLFIFGTQALTGGTDYRYQPGESSAIDAAVSFLGDMTDMFLAIDTTQPVWKPYANAGVNAYWRNHKR